MGTGCSQDNVLARFLRASIGAKGDDAKISALDVVGDKLKIRQTIPRKRHRRQSRILAMLNICR
jgi:hypothetical protein